MRRLALIGIGILATCVAPTQVVAQSDDLCPDLAGDRSALMGSVQDPQLGGLPMAGAEVTVWWETENDRDLMETVVSEDGLYVVCGVPRGIVLFAQAEFGGREGTVEAMKAEEPIARLDLTVSLAGDDDPKERAFPIVMDGSGRCPELLVPSVVRCVDFTNCSFVALGSVTARRVAGIDRRATIEDMVEQARRLGAHAVEDLRAVWVDEGVRPILARLDANLVQFSDDRCRRLAGVTG